MQAPGTHTLTSKFKKNFQKLEISVLVLYFIVLAEMVRFLFLHGPGKKRVFVVVLLFICSMNMFMAC